MKKTNLFPLLAVLALIASLSSFRVASRSVFDEQTRNVPAFHAIGLAYPANVILRQGSTQSLKVEGDKDQLADLVTEVKDGRLSIKRKDEDRNWNWSSNNNDRVTIYITVPMVDHLAVSGSGKIKGEGTFKAKSMDLAVSGSGGIQLNANVEDLSSRISGSGSIELRGEGQQSTISVSGSGSLKGFEFKTSDAKISISGSGTCEINATSTLKSSISGSGRVSYEGSPSVDSRVSGSGTVKKRG
ncbi:head GIN domain-containing protein [Rufibacter roseolus]|uniref:head GIN domain-containing protein n=1 Tax=Rufibacter roseolus TaxID=2817375 RepID=UPI001B3149B4|nr:head GIN domain-containing protein [Rufibacter roseolus]